jgi:hypothetical protein
MMEAEAFEPAALVLQWPWSWPRGCTGLQFLHARREHSCPARTSGFRCSADPARTSTTAPRRLRSRLVADASGAPGPWAGFFGRPIWWWVGTGSNRRPCGFQPNATHPGRPPWFAWAAFALVSRHLDGLVIQGGSGSCGSMQIRWAEQRHNRVRADVDKACRSWGQRRSASRT